MPASNFLHFLQQLTSHFFQLNTFPPTMPVATFQHPQINDKVQKGLQGGGKVVPTSIILPLFATAHKFLVQLMMYALFADSGLPVPRHNWSRYLHPCHENKNSQ